MVFKNWFFDEDVKLVEGLRGGKDREEVEVQGLKV
jgi:hypothetical protein